MDDSARTAVSDEPASRTTGAGPAAGPPPPGRGPRPVRWWRPRGLIFAGAVALLAVLGYSIGGPLSAPGTDSTAARLAEWGRGHGLSPVVNSLEKLQYRLHPPAANGAPPSDSPLATDQCGGESAPPPGTPSRRRPVVGLPSPPPVTPLAPTGMACEGRWKTVTVARGRPALRTTYLRPDPVHTSYVAGVAWMDPTLLRTELHPGTQEPGHGPWQTPSSIGPTARDGLVAAFNSAFRLAESRGGYYAEGRTIAPLVNGDASLVIRRDGSTAVGQWGRDLRMSPDVSVVRQNLALLVDNGQIAPGIDNNVGNRWGATLGNKLYVWRSGIGMTKTGALVYVAGNALSASSLARLLSAAGAVQAMELDINPEWTTFVSYAPSPTPATPMASKLLPDMQRSADRYYQTSTRDFFAVYQR